jgi:hypothetical protein
LPSLSMDTKLISPREGKSSRTSWLSSKIKSLPRSRQCVFENWITWSRSWHKRWRTNWKSFKG